MKGLQIQSKKMSTGDFIVSYQLKYGTDHYLHGMLYAKANATMKSVIDQIKKLNPSHDIN